MATAKKAAPVAVGSVSPNVLVVVVWVVSILAVGAGYFFLFYTPLDEERTAEVARRADLQNQRRTAEENLRRYNTDQAELARARQREESLRQVLPADPDIPGFMRSINALAEASGLQIALIRPVDERPAQYYARIPVELKVRGGYLALARFFHTISQLPRVINMENIKLQTPTEDPNTHDMILSARMLATTFRGVVNPPPGAARPAGSAAPAANGGAR